MDRQKLIECTRQIIEDGVGRSHLDKITEQHFLDRGEDYYTRLFYKVESNPENVEHLFEALVEWYDFWKNEFSDFNETASEKYLNNRLKTWTYCILNGYPEKYKNLSKEISVNLSEEEWSDIERIRQIRIHLTEKIQKNSDKAISDQIIMERLQQEELQEIQKQLEEEKSRSIKTKLSGKRLAVFSNIKWEINKLTEIQEKYGLSSIWTESSLKIPYAKRECDYIIILTSQAKHEVVRKLESLYGKDKIFLIDITNIDLAMESFVSQLLGHNFMEKL